MARPLCVDVGEFGEFWRWSHDRSVQLRSSNSAVAHHQHYQLSFDAISFLRRDILPSIPSPLTRLPSDAISFLRRDILPPMRYPSSDAISFLGRDILPPSSTRCRLWHRE